MSQFYIEGLKSLPAIMTAASVNRLSLAALLLLLTAGLIFYLMKPAPVIWRFLSIVLLVITGLAVVGQNVGGFFAPGLVEVFRGTQPTVNHFMLGARGTIRGSGATNAGFGYLFSLSELPPTGTSFINVWQPVEGPNRDLLYANPGITPNTGYMLLGFLQQ